MTTTGVIADLFDHALRTPERLAVVHDGEPLRYAAFAGQVAQAQQFLEELDLRPDKVVITAVEDMLVGWRLRLALRRLGITSAATPPARPLYPFRPSEVGTVIFGGSGSVEADLPCRVVRTPADLFDGVAPPLVATTRASGHIIATSGVTGTPKRLLIDRSNEAANISQRFALFGIGPESLVNVASWSPWTSVGHIVPLGCWSIGAGVVLQRGDAPALGFRRRDLTHAILTPGMLDELLRAPDDRLERNDGVRLWIGGAPLSRDLAEAARSRITRRLSVQVASSEAGLWCTTDIEGSADLSRHRIAPGRRVEVVDGRGCGLPPGEPGEVRLDQIPGLASYWSDEAATRLHFRAGWFYPGDTGVIDEDGRLRLLGRVAEVVNVAGAKVSLPGLERQIRRDLSADAVAVFCVKRGEAQDLHVAFRISAPLPRGLLATIGKGLMPPFANVHFHSVDSLPLTPSGKLRRAALKEEIMATWSGGVPTSPTGGPPGA